MLTKIEGKSIDVTFAETPKGNLRIFLTYEPQFDNHSNYEATEIFIEDKETRFSHRICLETIIAWLRGDLH